MGFPQRLFFVCQPKSCHSQLLPGSSSHHHQLRAPHTPPQPLRCRKPVHTCGCLPQEVNPTARTWVSIQLTSKQKCLLQLPQTLELGGKKLITKVFLKRCFISTIPSVGSLQNSSQKKPSRPLVPPPAQSRVSSDQSRASRDTKQKPVYPWKSLLLLKLSLTFCLNL